ncbi:MAG: YbgC/FadM family acyl-CoA thioesterase [Myxococcota bacterium]
MLHRHQVQVYYEDTDLSGVVYHANYLRYFERAREHLLGVRELVRLLEAEGIGFVVYKCGMAFKEGAVLGDVVEIRTEATRESDYRLCFAQNAWRVGQRGATGMEPKLLVEGTVELVCVDAQKSLARIPGSVLQRVSSS